MRVVMLTTNMARGGAETLVAQLAMELRRRGWDIHVVSMLTPSAFVGELAAAGVPLHAPGVRRIPSLLRALRPQVLHCHMFHANVAGRLMRLTMPFPVVISTLHSIAESGRASRNIAFRDLCYRWTDRLASRTVGVSQAVVDRHVEARAVGCAVVIPNGIDVERYRPNAESRMRMRRELGIADSEFVWIAVGRLIWKKNYGAMLDAFAKCKCGRLLIAGSGPDEAALRAISPEGTMFLGERKDVPDLMNAADAFVITSVVEGLPLALLEAAATGLPCVATPAGGILETGIGIVADDVADAMRQVASMSAADRRTLADSGRRRVQERYSLAAVTTEWEALYRSLT